MKTLTLGFIAAYGVFLALTLPAGLVYPHIGDTLAPLRLGGIDGNLWHGSAARVTIDDVHLGSLDWSWRPLALVRGRLGYDWNLDASTHRAAGWAAVSPGGHWALGDVTGRATAQAAVRWLDLRGVGLGGELDLDLENAGGSRDALGELAGTLRWTDAAVTRPLAQHLGDFTAVLEASVDGSWVTRVDAPNNPLGVRGSVVMEPSGRSRIAAVLTPSRDLDPDLRRGLRLAGTPRADGSVEIELQGTWK